MSKAHSPAHGLPFENDPLIQMTTELQQVRKNHRAAVLVAHGFIEVMVNAIIDARCKNAKTITSDNRGYPHSVRLVLLHEMNLISDQLFKWLNRFRGIRNRAAHKPLFKLTHDEITELAGKWGTASQIDQVCLLGVVQLWNAHPDIFAPLFLINFGKGKRQRDKPKAK